jgi:hypothetical protein
VYPPPVQRYVEEKEGEEEKKEEGECQRDLCTFMSTAACVHQQTNGVLKYST